MVNAQNWLDKWYPKEGCCLRKVNEKEYDWEVKLGNFGRNRAEIIHLYLVNQKLLGSLDLSDFVNLKYLNCSQNQLTSLELSKNTKLEHLNISKNSFSCQNPSWLFHLENLRKLDLSDNEFVGSLGFAKNMIDLEVLKIQNTRLNGLEHLPDSLMEIEFNEKLKKELEIYDNDLFLWKSAHSSLTKKSDKSMIRVDNYNKIVKIITTPDLLKEDLNKLSYASHDSSRYLVKADYLSFLFRDGRPFTWEVASEYSVFPKQILPLRLYNLSNKLVEKTENRPDIFHYLALSYSWGIDWENQGYFYGQDYKTKLTKLGRKALIKVNKTWGLFNQQSQVDLSYIWIDNFCINQSDPIEKGQEVAKQKDYYSNATATLIAIDEEVGDVNEKNESRLIKKCLLKIVKSSWFHRSWTFQEGFLSKQTVFMFDDYVVDGRMLSLAWAGLQENLGLKNNIFVTPLGWSYGVQENHSIHLSLGEALLAVKHRQQTVPIDGIYSILGLLSYGDKVEVKYKKKDCLCSEEERKNCNHWPIYSQENLELALSEIVKVAVEQGYGQELFSWAGTRSDNYWYLPQINSDGSTEIEGVNCLFKNYQLKNIKISLQGIQLKEEFLYLIKRSSKSNNQFIYDWDNSLIRLKELDDNLKVQFGDILVVVDNESNNNFLSILIPSNHKFPIKTVNVELSISHSKKPINSFAFVDLVNKKVIKKTKNINYYQRLLKNKDEQKTDEFVNSLEEQLMICSLEQQN